MLNQDSIAFERFVENAMAIIKDAELVHHWGDGFGGALLEAFKKELADAVGAQAHQGNTRKTRRSKIPAHVRTAVMEQYKYRCVSCGGHKSLTIDHLLPVCLGGSDDICNLQVLCHSCNSRKGGRVHANHIA